MTDILERLRKGWKHLHTDDIVEAANEIERLRHELAKNRPAVRPGGASR